MVYSFAESCLPIPPDTWRIHLKNILYVFIISVFTVSLSAQENLPLVHIITTGGTIASGGQQMKTGADLTKAIPQLDRVARITIEDYIRVGSSKITPENWRDIALRICEVLETNSDVSGVVVTHGTDTMEETAYFLHLTVKTGKPVVITGSMRSSTAVSADGPANLMNAVRLAASADGRGRGVMLLLNDEIHAAREVTKNSTVRLNAFHSPVTGTMGVTDQDRITFFRSSDSVVSGFQPFKLNSDSSFPRVDILYCYAGADGDMIRSSFEHGAEGVVIATVGNGNVSRSQEEAIREVLEQGRPVVFSSRTMSGRVFDSAGRYLSRGMNSTARVIPAGDLNPQKARVLLMLALTKTKDTEELADIFRKY